MPVQPTLQRKLLETKKRLSEPLISAHSLWCLSFSCLLAFLILAAQYLTRTGNWGLVRFDMPVASQPFADNKLNNFKETPQSTMNMNTSVLALTPTDLIYGDISSFSSAKTDTRNKFSVRHDSGSPRISETLMELQKWQDDRRRRLGIRADNILILLPDPAVPIAVVTVVADKIRESKMFGHIVMGGGLL